jgi:hypothetical protein
MNRGLKPHTVRTRTSSAYPLHTETVTIRVTLSVADYQAFKRLGNGYATHGIRAALNVKDNAWSKQ